MCEEIGERANISTSNPPQNLPQLLSVPCPSLVRKATRGPWTFVGTERGLIGRCLARVNGNVSARGTGRPKRKCSSGLLTVLYALERREFAPQRALSASPPERTASLPRTNVPIEQHAASFPPPLGRCNSTTLFGGGEVASRERNEQTGAHCHHALPSR